MKSYRALFLGLAASAVVAASLGGCVVVPGPDAYYGGSVLVAPPAPRVEYYGVAPYPGYIWLGGYWNWVGGRHEWVGGHWAAPRPGYRWEPHRWDRVGNGWRMRPGHWARERR
jgi:hypothetical protein